MGNPLCFLRWILVCFDIPLVVYQISLSRILQRRRPFRCNRLRFFVGNLGDLPGADNIDPCNQMKATVLAAFLSDGCSLITTIFARLNRLKSVAVAEV